MNKNYFWKGEVIRLRQYRESDTERKLQGLYDSEARSLLQDGITDMPVLSPEQYKEFFKPGKGKLVDNNLHESLRFAIENFEEEFVGWINVWDRNPRSGTFSFGVSIFSDFRQKGYAADAIKLILRYGFHECRMQKCNSASRADNKASIELHKSLGFQEEGRLRREIFTNNQFYDLVQFGLLKEEFKLD